MSATLWDPDPSPTPPETGPPDQLHPEHFRVVELDSDVIGETYQFDCYRPGGGAKVFRVSDGEVEVYAVNWADTDDPDDEMTIEWTRTGLTAAEVDRIRVFSWPTGPLLQSYDDLDGDREDESS